MHEEYCGYFCCLTVTLYKQPLNTSWDTINKTEKWTPSFFIDFSWWILVACWLVCPWSSGMGVFAWNNVETIAKLVKIATDEILPGAELVKMLFDA